MAEDWTIDDNRDQVARAEAEAEDEGEGKFRLCSKGHEVAFTWAHTLHGVPLICPRCREVLEG
jgi:hypothetical protein